MAIFATIPDTYNLWWATHVQNIQHTAHNVRIIRSGLKTYGKILERMGLKPYIQHRGAVDAQERVEIYNEIQALASTGKGLMDIYVKVGEKHEISADSTRRIYSQEKSKNK